MSYFPCDIPFMSDEELKENGIKIPKYGEQEETCNKYRNVEYRKMYYAVREFFETHTVSEFMEILIDVLHKYNPAT